MRKGVSVSGYPSRADLVSTGGYGTIHCNQNNHRWNAITSVNLGGTIYQAICFWNSAGKMVIGKRVLDAAWTLYTYDGTGGFANIAISGGDNHDVCVIGIDPNGFIHIVYDLHNEALKYAKSDVAINTWTGALTTGLSMVGTNETSITYPTFINDPAGNLYIIFRDGVSGNGDLFMYKYNHGTVAWAGVAGTTAGKLIDGKGETPDRSAYWDHPCFDSTFGSGGFFHLSWHWRVTGDTAGTNRDLCYVKWDGTNWKKANGDAQTIPIASTNCETIDNTNGANNGLTSFNSLYSDSNGHPHIVYPKTNTNRYLYHAYHNGTNWTITQLTTTPNRDLNDDSTAEIGLTASIAIDRSNNTIYVFYRDMLEHGGLMMLKSTNFTTWTKKNVYPYAIGWYLTKFDYVEFTRSGNLYFSIEEFFGTLLTGAQSAFPIYVWKVDLATL